MRNVLGNADCEEREDEDRDRSRSGVWMMMMIDDDDAFNRPREVKTEGRREENYKTKRGTTREYRMGEKHEMKFTLTL